MELEKLQKIIAEVLNVDAQEVTMDTTFRSEEHTSELQSR